MKDRVAEWLELTRAWCAKHWDDLNYVGPFVFVIFLSNVIFFGAVITMDRNTLGWFHETHPLAEASMGNLDNPHRWGKLTSLLLDQCIETFPDPSYTGVCKRISSQAIVAGSRGEHHFWIARYVWIYYFACLVTAYWAGTIAAGISVIVLRKGWDTTDPRLLSAGLSLVITSALVGSLPGVTAMQQNIEDNNNAYIAYDNIFREIQTFIFVGKSEGGIVEPGEFVHKVDKAMAELNGTHVHLDEDAINLGSQRLLESQKALEQGAD